MLAEFLHDRGFEFAVERAVFVSVRHRLFVSGSDRACERWIADYAIPGAGDLHLHHFYRAMAWLGEETGPVAKGALAPRCVRDRIEERLFERRRDLLGKPRFAHSALSPVFMDTATLSFTGAAGATLGEAIIEKDGKRITTRTAVTGQVDRVFQAVGVALPPNLREHAA